MRLRVSPITSNLRVSSLCSTTVRQVPLMATLAPICTPDVAPEGNAISKERKSGLRSIDLMFPLP